ncbi:MAG: hypothetical protein AMXMBFR4_33230 [Candidatus Hydrogenedentota bacterium]
MHWFFNHFTINSLYSFGVLTSLQVEPDPLAIGTLDTQSVSPGWWRLPRGWES